MAPEPQRWYGQAAQPSALKSFSTANDHAPVRIRREPDGSFLFRCVSSALLTCLGKDAAQVFAMQRLAAIAIRSIEKQGRPCAKIMAHAGTILRNRIEAAEVIGETSSITIGVIGPRGMGDAIIEKQNAAGG